MKWRHPESRTPPARLGGKWIAIRGDKSIGDIRRPGRHQPDWETNESLYGETNELETKSRSPPARLGDKWIAIRGDKSIGDIRRAGRHQPDWETNESFYGETNELETSREPVTTSQTGRQMNRYMGRQMNWRQPESRTPPARRGDKWIVIWGDKWIGDSRRAGHHQPDWETNESLYAETIELETAEEPDTDKWIVIWGDKWIGDSRRAGHHQPDWETNESLYAETDELETSEEPDTTSQTGRQMNRYMGRQMNWRHPESRTPPLGQSRTPI